MLFRSSLQGKEVRKVHFVLLFNFQFPRVLACVQVYVFSFEEEGVLGEPRSLV